MDFGALVAKVRFSYNLTIHSGRDVFWTFNNLHSLVVTIHTLKKELIPDNSHRGLCSQLPVGLLLSYDHNPELQRDEKISAVRGSENSRGEVMATGRTEGLCSEERPVQFRSVQGLHVFTLSRPVQCSVHWVRATQASGDMIELLRLFDPSYSFEPLWEVWVWDNNKLKILPYHRRRLLLWHQGTQQRKGEDRELSWLEIRCF